MGVDEHDTYRVQENKDLKNPPPPPYKDAFKYALVSETCWQVAISSPTTALLSVDACPFFPKQSPPLPPPRVSAESFTLDAIVAAAARPVAAAAAAAEKLPLAKLPPARPAEIATPPLGGFLPHFVATQRKNRVLYTFQKKADFTRMFCWTEETFSIAFDLATKQKQKDRLYRTYQLWRVYMANPRS